MKFIKTISVLLFSCSTVLGLDLTAREVIDSIALNESLINDIQCEYTKYVPENDLSFEISWGYENGKEFRLEKRQGQWDDGEIRSYTQLQAFDGKVRRAFAQIEGQQRSQGGIHAYDPLAFSVSVTPRTLLGHTLCQHGIFTLSELLSEQFADQISVRPEKLGNVDSIVLEATGWSTSDGLKLMDIRIWVDPERDFRMLKAEKYESPDDEGSLAEFRGERWKYLTMEIKDIELRKVDGIWFPFSGERVLYTIEPDLPLEVKTEECLLALYPGMTREEIAKEINYISVPRSLGRKIDIKKVKLNHGIDPAKFTVEFPDGCRVRDSIADLHYVVGYPDGLVSQQLDSLDTAEMPGSAGQTSFKPVLNQTEESNPAGTEDVELEQSYDTQQQDQESSDEKTGYVGWSLLTVLAVAGLGIAYIKVKK